MKKLVITLLVLLLIPQSIMANSLTKLALGSITGLASHEASHLLVSEYHKEGRLYYKDYRFRVDCINCNQEEFKDFIIAPFIIQPFINEVVYQYGNTKSSFTQGFLWFNIINHIGYVTISRNHGDMRYLDEEEKLLVQGLTLLHGSSLAYRLYTNNNYPRITINSQGIYFTVSF